MKATNKSIKPILHSRVKSIAEYHSKQENTLASWEKSGVFLHDASKLLLFEPFRSPEGGNSILWLSLVVPPCSGLWMQSCTALDQADWRACAVV